MLIMLDYVDYVMPFRHGLLEAIYRGYRFAKPTVTQMKPSRLYPYETLQNHYV